MASGLLESEVMKDLSGKNFGLLIAYIVPGAIVLIGLGAFSPTVQAWLVNPSESQPSIGGFLFVTLASVAAGMTASAVRWATIDRLHHWTGIEKPVWDDSSCPTAWKRSKPSSKPITGITSFTAILWSPCSFRMRRGAPRSGTASSARTWASFFSRRFSSPFHATTFAGITAVRPSCLVL